uniref:NADH dehydrogenase subunit 3 n=1 Tax=Intoshia linei TaxID=1819745 RepID=UPI001EDD8549|nr:NADH dehydrogenase subunit 3 [Intoshia linei]UIB41617.1 NADH dehydrogenase subunit 3 [Intoshia linei]
MILLLIFCLFCMVISLLLLFLNKLFIFKKNNLNKQLPFECGSFPFVINYSHISLKYFKIIMLFLVFDIEFALVLPMLFIYFKMMDIFSLLSFYIIINFIVLSLFYEIGWGVLSWTK